MYVLLTLFEEKNTIQKGPLFPIFRKSSSIHEINPALIASIVLKKIYFYGICALSKNNGYFHAFLCVRSRSQILRVKNVKKYKISRILTLPSWQHCVRRLHGRPLRGGGGGQEKVLAHP